MDNIINEIKSLGLNEYEAKAYVALLEEYPISGYVLSKNSGVPRSRIYEVLDNLSEKQLVFEEKGEKAKLYSPVDPDMFIAKFKQEFKRSIKSIDGYIRKKYNGKKDENKLMVINNRDRILDFIVAMIERSEKRIALFVWEEEIELLKHWIDKAKSRGVVLKGIYFGENNPYTELVTHRRLKRYIAEKKERYMIVAVDEKEVISGVVSREEDSKVTWTNDYGFVEMSEEYIAHDIVVNMYSQELKGKEKKAFEKFSDKVREEYFGTSGVEYEDIKD